MTAQQAKILCCGDVNGNFVKLIEKLTVTEKKNGPFDSLFCVGEFFGDDDEANQKVIKGKMKFPIPTYILGPSNPRYSHLYPEESIEFSSNLTYLGKKGLVNTASGLQIAYLSGVEGTSKEMSCFDKSDVEELLNPLGTQVGFSGTDILLTSMWPTDVARHSIDQPSVPIPGSILLSKLAAQLKPRYHFAGLGGHYERQPYRNHQVHLEPASHTTRFIGLAPVGNKEKQKWLYACNVKPMRKMEKLELTAQPPNASESPYRELLDLLLAREALYQAIGEDNRPQGSQNRFKIDGGDSGNGPSRHTDGSERSAGSPSSNFEHRLETKMDTVFLDVKDCLFKLGLTQSGIVTLLGRRDRKSWHDFLIPVIGCVINLMSAIFFLLSTVVTTLNIAVATVNIVFALILLVILIHQLIQVTF
ncbi:hypothetical protein CRE_31174 [Caenorhabditis remanei]|uniref:Uncharacterized protein n=1 Tax=Caenorhabditis remanei TaxID=31234 RepID=E3LTI5_CAERE|nr:hypothetical protein CRE_31174 [Caenorhabditis remanei]